MYAAVSDSANYRLMLITTGSATASRVDRSLEVDKAELSRSSLAFSARIMLQPDHLLAVGLESGWLPISHMLVKSDATLAAGTTLTLSAIPLLCVFSMEKYGVEISGGVGSFSYRVDVESQASTITSSDWEIGWCAGAAYRMGITKSLLIGAEARVYAIPERSVTVSCAGLRLQYQLWY